MTQTALAAAPMHDSTKSAGRPRLALIMAGGFLYWILFLLLLEPGNIFASLRHGGLDVGREALRIVAAALLGAMITPLLVSLMRRYPVAGVRRWSNLAKLVASDAVLSASLVVVACLLARPILHEDQRPLLIAIGQEVAGNGPLVGFAIAAFLMLAHLISGRPSVSELRSPSGSRWRTSVTIKTRGHIERVDLDQVDWIEAQGNYLALHGSGSVWLLRETLTRFEAQIDPRQFTRIHRRTLVAADRVGGVRSMGAGDAIVELKDGTELRMSRSHRDNLLDFLSGGAPRRGKIGHGFNTASW